MNDKPQDLRAELANGLKAIVSAHATKIAEMRARELKKSVGRKLMIDELCPMCGNADTINSCTCLRKAETEGKHECIKCGKETFSLNKTPAGKPICGFCNRKPPVPDHQRKMPVQKSLSEMCKEELKSDPKMHKGEVTPAKMKPGTGPKPPAGPTTLEGTGVNGEKDRDAYRDRKWSDKASASTKATRKDELPIVKPAPEKSAKGSILPDDKKSKKQDLSDGNGGKITKKSELAKTVLPGTGPKPMAPVAPVVGVAGKQPVGQGGGDAFKVPGLQKQTPIKQVNQEMGGFKSLASSPVKLPGTGAKLVNAPKPGMPVAGNMQKPVAGVIGKGELKSNPRFPHLSAVLNAPEKKKGVFERIGDKLTNWEERAHGAMLDIGLPPRKVKKDELNTAVNHEADKKAGGVGWLNSIRASAKKPKAPKPSNDVMAVRDRMNLKAAKTEMPAPTGGLNAANHNRRLSVIK